MNLNTVSYNLQRAENSLPSTKNTSRAALDDTIGIGTKLLGAPQRLSPARNISKSRADGRHVGRRRVAGAAGSRSGCRGDGRGSKRGRAGRKVGVGVRVKSLDVTVVEALLVGVVAG